MINILVALALSGSTVADARAIVLAQLKDPQSAQFSGIRLHKDPETGRANGFCGYVNARNSYGGYAGKSYFIGSFADRRVVILDPDLSDPDLCR